MMTVEAATSITGWPAVLIFTSEKTECFFYRLKMMTGYFFCATDGLPEHFLPHEYAELWLKLIHQEIRKIEEVKSDINPYTTNSEAEFLAVAAEYFFEKPEKLKDKHPQL